MSRVGTRGRRNMAIRHQDASAVVQVNELDKAFDEFLARHHKKMRESMEVALPALASGMGIDKTAALSLALELNPMFGISIMPPRAVAGIDSGIGRLNLEDETAEITITKPRPKGIRDTFAAYGVPPVFAPRDNGFRQSREDREMYDELSAQNTYTPPERTNDRWGSPVWPESVKLVDGRHPDAGEWGKLCYRTACQKPNAFYYNRGSYKHYCKVCADLIDRENMLGERLCFLAAFEGQHA